MTAPVEYRVCLLKPPRLSVRQGDGLRGEHRGLRHADAIAARLLEPVRVGLWSRSLTVADVDEAIGQYLASLPVKVRAGWKAYQAATGNQPVERGGAELLFPEGPDRVATLFAELAAYTDTYLIEARFRATGPWARVVPGQLLRGESKPPRASGPGSRLKGDPQAREQYDEIVSLRRRQPGITHAQIGGRLGLSLRQVKYRL